MRSLEIRQSVLVKLTLDYRLEQRAVEQIVRPHESTAEIVVSGFTTRGQLSYEDIVTRIFNFIAAARFPVDVISIRKLNSAKENESSSTPGGDSAVHTSFSLILRFKSVQVCNEVMRLKILKGNVPAVSIFPNLPDLAENKVFLNEFLAKRCLIY